MKKRFWIKRLFLWGLVPVSVTASEQELTQQFRNAIKEVDRIVLWETMTMSDTRPGLMLELKGADLAKSLGEAVEVERRTEHCLCITSPEIRLYRGEELQFSVTLHHSTRLRDENGPWLGDVELTEASAIRFREWFAARGYRGFVEIHEHMLRAMREHQLKWAQLRALFPGEGKELPGDQEYLGDKETNRRIDALRARMPDPTGRILACWRGLGALQEIAKNRYHPAESFLMSMLMMEDFGDIGKALASVADGDAHAWSGAYFYWESADEYRWGGKQQDILNIIGDDGLVRLVRGILRHDGDALNRRFIISSLKKQDRLKVRALLVEIAEGKLQGPPTDKEVLRYDYWALLALADLKDLRAETLVAAKLKQPSLPKAEKLSLEVICARLDDTVKLSMEHLTETENAVAEMAWTVMGKEADGWSIETLQDLATRTRSYEGEFAVREALRKRGLRQMDEKERVEALWRRSYIRRTDSIEEVRRAIREIEDKPAERGREHEQMLLLSRLRHDEGRHLIKAGEYEKARSSLIQAEEKEVTEELIIACLATGRMDEARMHARLGSLVQRAYVSLAQGEFEEAAMDFDAAARLDIVDEAPVLFAHLAYILAGKEARSRLPGWENPFRDGWVLADEDGKEPLFWPETGIMHLQGKLTWAELEASLAEGQGGDRAESRYGMSLIGRARGDLAEEKIQLARAVATKEFSHIGYVLALHRQRELAALGK